MDGDVGVGVIAQGTGERQALAVPVVVPGVHDEGQPRSGEAEPRPLATRDAAQWAAPGGVFVPQSVAARAAAAPGAAALVEGDRTLTYQELDARADRLASYLRGLGVGTDIPVGLCLDRSIEMVVAALGILKAGGAYLPLDPTYPAERLAFMLNDARVPVLVTRQRVTARLPAGPWRVVDLDADARIIDAAPAVPAVPLAAVQLAYVIYTSGSTGQPKGVQITHANLLNLVSWHQRAFAVTAADRATHLASPAFDAAGWELWPYLTAGASVYLVDEDTRRAPAPLRDWLVARRITIGFLPTALAEQVMALEWPREVALRVLLTGGDALHHYPSPALPFTVVNNYGPTEGTVVATSGPVDPAERGDLPPPIGHPIDNTRVYILDAHLRPVSAGAPGELCIGGAGVARGYLNRPALTAEKFIPDPFADSPDARLYKTGDRARYLPDGRLAFLGRIDEQIEILGYRIEPNEIAVALNRHPAIRTSVVAAREEAAGDKRLVAYVVSAPGARATTTAGTLRAFLGAQLPNYMVPALFVWLDELPLTPNGKVDRAALPVPDAENMMTEQDTPHLSPRTPVEQRVAEIVAALLNLERVGVEDNFFMLGGHSLLGTQLITRMRATFGVDLTLRSLFETPTVAGLAAEVARLIIAKLEAMTDDEARQLLQSLT